MERWQASVDHSGSLLPLPLAPTETCDPALTPGRFDPLSVTITSPTMGGAVRYPSFIPEITITGKSPIRSVRFLVDNKPLRTFDQEPFRGSMRVPRTIDRAGRHTLRVEVTDAYFKTAVHEVEFVFE